MNIDPPVSWEEQQYLDMKHERDALRARVEELKIINAFNRGLIHNTSTENAALRARCTELEQAIEVIQSSRDICLQTFTEWARDEYGPAKHALRHNATLQATCTRLRSALEQIHAGKWTSSGDRLGATLAELTACDIAHAALAPDSEKEEGQQ